MTHHHPAHEVELYRDDDVYTVIVDLEGFDRGDVEVSFHDGRLHVEAEHVDAAEGRNRVVHRHVGVPKTIDVEDITATMTDGVLEVTLPIVGDGDVHGVPIDVE